jgi:hypothetical protein
MNSIWILPSIHCAICWKYDIPNLCIKIYRSIFFFSTQQIITAISYLNMYFRFKTSFQIFLIGLYDDHFLMNFKFFSDKKPNNIGKKPNNIDEKFEDQYILMLHILLINMNN